MIEIKSKYSSFDGTYVEYSIDLEIIPSPVENKTEEIVEEEIIEEPVVEDVPANETEQVDEQAEEILT